MVMKERFPTWGDIVPAKLSRVRFKAVTLWGCEPHATPVQLQKWEESSQEAKAMRGSSFIRDLNVISASLSASFAGTSAAEHAGNERSTNMDMYGETMSL